MRTVKPASTDDDDEGKGAPVAGGGGPPYDGGMETRLTVLETRFDTILPTLATKADVDALRIEMHQSFAGVQKSFAEVQKSFVEVQKSFVEVHKSIADIHKSIADLQKSIAEMHKTVGDTHKWVIGTMIALFVGLGGLILSTKNTASPGAVVQAPAAAVAPARSMHPAVPPR